MATLTDKQVLTLLAAAGVPMTSNDLGKWLATAKAESSLRSDVVNSIGCVGLFQINQPVHVKSHPTWTVSWLQDPANNVAAAKVVSNNWTNTSPWVSSKLGQAANLPYSILTASQFLQTGGEAALEGVVTSGAGQTVVGAAEAAVAPLNAIAKVVAALSDPGVWLRIGYGIIGIALVVGGVVVLSRPVIEPAAKAATKAAKVVA